MKLILLFFAAGLVVTYVIVPNLQEVWHGRRRRQVAREMAAAAEGHSHHDPSRPGVLVLGAHRRPAVRPPAVVAPVLNVPAPHAGVAMGSSARLLAFRRELAARGQELDDLRIEG